MKKPVILKAIMIGESLGVDLWLEGENLSQPANTGIDIEGRRLSYGWVVVVSNAFPAPPPWPYERVSLPLDDENPGGGFFWYDRGCTNPVVVSLAKLRWLAEIYHARGEAIGGRSLPIPTEAEAAAINRTWTGLDRSAANKALFNEWFRVRKPQEVDD